MGWGWGEHNIHVNTHIKYNTADVELCFRQVVECDGDKVVGKVNEAQVHQDQVLTGLPTQSQTGNQTSNYSVRHAHST